MADMTQAEFNAMLQIALAQGLPGGIYTSKFGRGEDIDAALDAAWAVRNLGKLNLLDNWYFAGGGSQQGGGQFPINQMGATTYNKSGYCIDRWKKTTGTSATLVVAKEGLTATGANAFIRQLSEHVDYYDGKTLTWSVLYKNKGLTTITSVFKKGTLFITNNTGEANVSANVQDDHEVCGLYALTGDYIVAAKLEIGSAQTLAHKDGDIWVLNDPPPNKALELAKCQRYYLRYSKEIIAPGYVTGGGISYRMGITLPVAMRATPAVSMTNWVGRKSDGYSKLTPGNLAVSPTNLSVPYFAGDKLIIQDSIASAAVDTNNEILTYVIRNLELDASL